MPIRPDDHLRQVPLLQPFVERLERLGYSTLSEFLTAARFATHALSGYLYADVKALAGQVPGDVLAAAYKEMDELPRLPLGATLVPFPERTPVTVSVSAADYSRLPAAVDHTSDFGPVRDQGERGTCCAFAVAAEVEWRRGTDADFSEQFLFYFSKQFDHDEVDATRLTNPYAVMLSQGVCVEGKWRYNPTKTAGNVAQGPPPPPALPDGLTHQIKSYGSFNPRDAGSLKRAIGFYAACPTFAFPVFPSWYYSAAVRRTGDIPLPPPGEQDIGGHAICLVGYQDDGTSPGGGRFRFRNSWGPSWGANGYGTIPYDLVAFYGNAAFTIGDI